MEWQTLRTNSTRTLSGKADSQFTQGFRTSGDSSITLGHRSNWILTTISKCRCPLAGCSAIGNAPPCPLSRILAEPKNMPETIPTPDECDECDEPLKGQENWTPEGDCLCDECWEHYARKHL